MPDYFAIENLKIGFKTFEGRKGILDLDRLTLAQGRNLGLVGESGVGKTVLAYAILGLLDTPPGYIEGGRILFKGEDLLQKTQSELRRIRGREIAMIFQDPMSSLNPVFTIGSQMIRVVRRNQGVGTRAAEKIALEKIDLVQLPDKKNIMGKYPHELSGGQRQRVIIALALCCGAEFIIADEPTRNLDVTIQAGILKLLARLQRELKVSILFIANNLGLVSATCDRVAIIKQGRIVEQGPTREVLTNPQHPYTRLLIDAVPDKKSRAAGKILSGGKK